MNRYLFDHAKHLHSWDLKPLIGTSTAVGVIDKQLAWWASGMACKELGWNNPNYDADGNKIPYKNKALIEQRGIECVELLKPYWERIRQMPLNEFWDLLCLAYRAHNIKKEESKDAGIDMHALLEEYVIEALAGREQLIIHPRILKFHEWAQKNVNKFLFAEIHCYSETLGTGGIVDLGYEDMNGDYVLGDYKSSKEPYLSHWAQTGGYDLQISENGGFTDKGELIFKLDKPFKYYAIFCERAGLDKPFFDHRTERIRSAFKNALGLHKDKMFLEDK